MNYEDLDGNVQELSSKIPLVGTTEEILDAQIEARTEAREQHEDERHS